MDVEKMTTSRKSAKLADVGRPKIRPLDEDTTLSFKASAELIGQLDAEAERMSAEKPEGSSRVSRSEAIKIILKSWIKAHPTKPRQ